MRDYVGIFRGSPLLKALIPFILGIYWGDYIPCGLTSLLWVTWGLLGGVVAWHIWSAKHRHTYITITSHGLIWLILFLLGTLRIGIERQSLADKDIQHLYQKGMIWQGVVTATQHHQAYDKCHVDLHTLIQDSVSTQVNTTIILYDYTHRGLVVGMSLAGTDHLVRIKNKGNPGEFDAEGFYQRKGIFYSTFIRRHNTLSTSSAKAPSWFIKSKNQIKQHITELFATYLDHDSLSIQLSLALLLGKDVAYSLSEEVMEDFVTAGIVHIIVISGFQIGILANSLSFLLGLFCRKRKKMPWILALLVMGLVWGFIVLVGAEISILRAGLMFSFVYINQMLGHNKQSPFQVLALAAMIILMLNPFDAWSLGFLYSFSALLGIFVTQALTQPIIQKPKFIAPIRHILSEFCMSIGASLFTIPITTVVFGKFYTYFFIAGLLAVYLSILLLYLSCLMIVFAWWQGVAQLCGALAKYTAHFLLNIVHGVSGLSYASLDISMTLAQGLLLGGGCFLFIYGIRNIYYRKILFCGLLCIVIALSLHITEVWERKKQLVLCALVWDSHHIPLLMVNGNKATWVISEDMLNQPKKLDQLEKGLRQYFHLSQLERNVTKNHTNLEIVLDDTLAVLSLGEPKHLSGLSCDISQGGYILLNSQDTNLLKFALSSNKKIIVYSLKGVQHLPRIHQLVSNGAFILRQ